MKVHELIVKNWNEVDDGSLKKAKTEEEIRVIKNKMYTEVQNRLEHVLSDRKDPRASIRRAVNTKVFGYKPKKITPSS